MPQSGFTRVLNDVSELCELQWQLFVVDSSEAGKSMMPAAISGVLALVFVAAMTIATTLGCGFVQAASTTLTLGSAFLLVGFLLLLLAGTFGYFAARGLRRSFAHYEDSKAELSENIRWLKATILDPESPRNQFGLHQTQTRREARAEPVRRF